MGASCLVAEPIHDVRFHGFLFSASTVFFSLLRPEMPGTLFHTVFDLF